MRSASLSSTSRRRPDSSRPHTGVGIEEVEVEQASRLGQIAGQALRDSRPPHRCRGCCRRANTSPRSGRPETGRAQRLPTAPRRPHHAACRWRRGSVSSRSRSGPPARTPRAPRGRGHAGRRRCEPGCERLVHTPVEPDGSPAGTEGKPIQVDRGSGLAVTAAGTTSTGRRLWLTNPCDTLPRTVDSIALSPRDPATISPRRPRRRTREWFATPGPSRACSEWRRLESALRPLVRVLVQRPRRRCRFHRRSLEGGAQPEPLQSRSTPIATPSRPQTTARPSVLEAVISAFLACSDPS